ncbi:MAG: hypothetical protein KAI71_03265 [Candidatus Pacebacteria bacterium]|nr:hypothetical protein [Candidatus Paceibacterota bacterium]
MIGIIFFIFLFLLAIFLIYKKYQEGRELKEQSAGSEEAEETQTTDPDQEESKFVLRFFQVTALVVFVLLVFALLSSWGDKADNEAKIIRTDGSGDCEDEVYPDGVKISNVKSDSDLSFTSDQKIGRGRRDTLSFYYKGTGGNVSLVVLPLKNLPENQVNPRSFETVDFTDEWTLYETSFCAPAECQFVVILSVPEGCEGEIKDFKIK